MYRYERSTCLDLAFITNYSIITNSLVIIRDTHLKLYHILGRNRGSYKLDLCIIYVVCAPHIVAHPSNTSAAAPFGAVFNCSIQVYGYLTVTWYRSNEKPVPSKAYSTLIHSMNGTTSTLTIPNVTSEDVDTYYCEAWANRRAAQSLKANLFLAGIHSVYICVYIVYVTSW